MKKIKIVVLIAVFIGAQGCSYFDGISYDRYAGVAKISNAERTFVVDWEVIKDAEGEEKQLIRRCLEAPGPAALLNDSKFESKVKAGTKNVTDAELSLLRTNTESVSKLYEISSILQYTHAMSYRFCEAALNRYISPEDYVKKLEILMSDTKALLEIQVRKTEAETQKIQAEAMLKNASQ